MKSEDSKEVWNFRSDPPRKHKKSKKTDDVGEDEAQTADREFWSRKANELLKELNKKQEHQ